MPLAESIFQQKPCHQDLCKIEIVTKRFSGQVCGLAGAKWDSTQQSLLYKVIILTSQSFRKSFEFQGPRIFRLFVLCSFFLVALSGRGFYRLLASGFVGKPVSGYFLYFGFLIFFSVFYCCFVWDRFFIDSWRAALLVNLSVGI